MKILIADDHPIVRSGLRRLLAREPGFEVEEAASGREALTVFRDYRPDLVVLDLSMPGVSGLEVIGRLKIEDPGVRIVVLSMHQEVIYATRALRAGASGFISKTAPVERLIEAIGSVAAGRSYIEHEIAQEMALTNIRAPGLPLWDLTAREFEIVRLLAGGRSLQQIADAVGVSYKTAANSCGQIRAKLRVARTADLVRLAIQHGICGE